jgi:hypothetical protein
MILHKDPYGEEIDMTDEMRSSKKEDRREFYFLSRQFNS